MKQINELTKKCYKEICRIRGQ